MSKLGKAGRRTHFGKKPHARRHRAARFGWRGPPAHPPEHPAAASLPLGKQRATVYRYRGFPVVVTYHPKVLLRASADKAKAWADLCLAMELVDAA